MGKTLKVQGPTKLEALGLLIIAGGLFCAAATVAGPGLSPIGIWAYTTIIIVGVICLFVETGVEDDIHVDQRGKAELELK